MLEERYQRLLQLFKELKVTGIQDLIEGKLDSVEAYAAVVHEGFNLPKDEKRRADFDVYLKKFLSSLDIILPHQEGQPYRVPAKRLGYIQRVAKERYKDDTLNLSDAGQDVDLPQPGRVEGPECCRRGPPVGGHFMLPKPIANRGRGKWWAL